MLALATMRIEPNVRIEEALDWALRKRWIGLDARGRALIAAVVLANNGETGLTPAIQQLAEKSEIHWAVAWGLALRLCRKLANCNPVALERSSLSLENGRIVLTLDELTSSLYSPSVAKNLARLAEWLGLEPQTRGLTCG